MTDRNIYCLFVDLFENGQRKDVRDLPKQTLDALCMAVEDLWSPTYHSKREYIAFPSDDGDHLYLVYYDHGIQSAFPSNWADRTVTVGAPKVNERTLNLVGDRIPVGGGRLGWTRLEVQFSDV